MMLGIAWAGGIDPFWLGKKEMFEGPLTGFFRWTRGLPVDRDNPAGLINELVEASGDDESFAVVITPEGTRGKSEYWKSGFRRIAIAADIPLVLGFPRGPGRTCGFGPTIYMTDDVSADMEKLREFYDDKPGIRDHDKTVARLREEDEPQEG